jgi:hypothetical protein
MNYFVINFITVMLFTLFYFMRTKNDVSVQNIFPLFFATVFVILSMLGILNSDFLYVMIAIQMGLYTFLR